MLAEAIKLVAEETQEDRQAYRHRPSSACKCIRSLVYHATGIEAKPLPGRALLVFDDSKCHEELTANWIKKTAYKLHSEQMYVDIFEINGVKVGGSIDGIIQDLTGKDYLWEHKAINHFSFQRISDDASAGHEYYVQCALYLCGLQKVQPDITEALLCIKNKNTAQYFEYFVVSNWPDIEIYNIIGTQRGSLVYRIENVIGTCEETFGNVDLHIARKTLPDRPYTRDDWHCSYCGWQDGCWENYIEEIKAMPGNVNLANVFFADQVPLLNECVQLQHIKSDAEKRLKEIKEKIKFLLNGNKVKDGFYDDIIVNRSFRDVKAFAVAARTDEILSIKKMKGGGGDNDQL